MWWSQYLLTVFSFLLAILLIFQMLRERRAPGSAMAWLLAMVLLPYVGVPLFLLLGGRKLRQVRENKGELYKPLPADESATSLPTLERLLRRRGLPDRTDDNEVVVLHTGESAYAALCEALEGATRRIHITTFILTLDSVGKSILEILEKKARQGVEVRLLLDGLGSFWTFRWRFNSLKRAGGEVAFFLPIFHIPFSGHTNLRNHRKHITVDSQIAILGGTNIATEYLGPTPSPTRWVDLSVRLRGSAVADVEALFVADWCFASGKPAPHPLTALEPIPRPARGGDQSVQVVASGPDVRSDSLYDTITSAVFEARSRIWIATPYFIPDETLGKALELAALRGVEVRLVIPKRSNHFFADVARRGYLSQLERAGGQISYHVPTMLHAKVLIVDDRYALVGSANFDMRSLLLNFEACVLLSSPKSLNGVDAWYRKVLGACVSNLLPRGWRAELIEGLGRIIGPFL